jgi:hypothetical protein
MFKMITFKTVGSIFGLIVLVTGLLFLIVPEMLAHLYNLVPNAVDDLASRNFGASYIGMAALIFACLRTSDYCTMRAACLAMSFSALVSGGTLLYNIFDSASIPGSSMLHNIPAWVTLGIYVLFVILFLVARGNVGKTNS